MNERTHDRDAGVSLIELIVYVMLISIVLGTTTMILVNSWRTQSDVTSVTDATNRGQAMGSTIERAIRNGLAFEIDPTGTELRVRTSLAGDLACQAFLLTNGQARIALSASALPASSAAWTDWEQGIQQDDTSPYFAESGQVVTYSFEIRTDSAPVRIAGEASTRSTPTGVSAPCW